MKSLSVLPGPCWLRIPLLAFFKTKLFFSFLMGLTIITFQKDFHLVFFMYVVRIICSVVTEPETKNIFIERLFQFSWNESISVCSYRCEG